MKLIKKYAGLLLMLTLLVGFTSCEDDEDLEERMFGRVWVGDVGMNAVNGRILYNREMLSERGLNNGRLIPSNSVIMVCIGG